MNPIKEQLQRSLTLFAAVILGAAVLLPTDAHAVVPKVTYDPSGTSCTVTIGKQTTTYNDLNECRKLERDLDNAENAVIGGVVLIIGLTALVTAQIAGRGDSDSNAFRQATGMLFNPDDGFSFNLNVTNDDIRGFGSFSQLNPGIRFKLSF